MILENFIYTDSKILFLKELKANKIPEDIVVFISETKELWHRGTFYGSLDIMSPEVVEDMCNIIFKGSYSGSYYSSYYEGGAIGAFEEV